ncbi:MAG: hypothetical protein EU532_02605 [Promethearchaeota archaeon]|nr:MAG: hypothetical protein EU532_02605 [Candidatus Lokiarchaeota archaeon]
MNEKNDKRYMKEILALEKILELIQAFCDKNPIRKSSVNYNRFKNKISELKTRSKEENKNKDLRNILKKLKIIIRKEIFPEIYYIVGGHGGVIIDDMGFCEFDSPQFALERLIERMNFAILTNIPYNIEVAVSCFEWLHNHYPDRIKEFADLFKKGRFEIINPTYSQPYNLVISEESNIKQFEYGLKELNRLGLDCNIYYCSEVSLHPQIPQILKGFNIEFGSLRTRLLGTCPTSNSGVISWIGLDNSQIRTISDQPGIFNGEYWHGTFYREIPNLLFQAASRPFMKRLIFSSIEDFIMPMPFQEEVWRISKISDIFGKFISCVELFPLIETEGEFKYKRDDFSLGEYMFVESELFLNNKKSEIALISAEIINCILGLFNEKSNDHLFDELWKTLLLTQAHDNYVVPYVQTGDYSAQQLSKEEYQRLEIKSKRIPISELSIDLQKDIQNNCKNFINESLIEIANSLIKNSNRNNENQFDFFIFNPTIYPRKDIVSIPIKVDNASKMVLIDERGEELDFIYQNSIIKFIPNVPSMGYHIYSLVEQNQKIVNSDDQFLYDILIMNNNQSIEIRFNKNKVYILKFGSSHTYKLTLIEQIKNNIENRYIIQGEIKNKIFTIEIIQYNGINRLEFILNSDLLEKIILIPAFKISKSLINYPFGIEETKRSNIQSLDFLWLIGEDKSIIYIQKNSQQFIINRKNFELHNLIKKKGVYEFSISILHEKDFCSAYQQVYMYKFNILGTAIQGTHEYDKKSDSWLSFNPEISLTNLWRRNNGSFLRIFNPSKERKQFKISGSLIQGNLIENDFRYNNLKELKKNTSSIDAWKIQNLKV